MAFQNVSKQAHKNLKKGSTPQLYCGMRLILNNAPHTHTTMDLIKYAATPPNQPRYILTDYFNNYNFSKLK
jgi:hypothetical protein